MSLSFELSIEVSEQYNFNKKSLQKIEQNFNGTDVNYSEDSLLETYLIN